MFLLSSSSFFSLNLSLSLTSCPPEKKKKKQINPSIETRKGKRVFQLMEAIQVPLNSCVISLTSAWFFQLLSWYVEIDKVQN